MKLPSQNSDLYRRLRLYGLGFLIGCFVVSIAYKGRGCELPGSQKLRELTGQQMVITSADSCKIKCTGLTVVEFRELLKTGKVDFDKSDVRAKPYGIYLVSAKKKDGTKFEVSLTDKDTVTVFNSISGLPANCNCN